ncbi:di-heme oxidoredictase family protein [Thalassoroseus pseudoceratinae]|uniref:di-heme oxidoredictase family protein n=1 Tax=Thalassoroseus pseudoceratinae TaxID=2713176 RepID=UPI00141DEC67|nr:di-heme oxidoredictase family protein [Thalassoroseus pseudoceratinae]
MTRRRCLIAGGLLVLGLIAGPIWSTAKETESQEKTAVAEISGAELFQREWLPDDSRSHGGDGLGPVFNDSSCVACHNQGGAGGGGPLGKNVNIISAVFNGVTTPGMIPQPRRSVPEQLFRSLIGLDNNARQPRVIKINDETVAKRRKQLVDEVAAIHPGFRTAGSVVVHHGSTADGYPNWRSKFLNNGFNQFQGVQTFAAPNQALILNESFDAPQAVVQDIEAFALESVPEEAHSHTHQPVQQAVDWQALNNAKMQARNIANHVMQHGNFTVTVTQRNPTALFGIGAMDQVSDEALEAAAKRKFEKFPEVSGRVARLADGRIGRFGWKAQKATLEDFTLTACAVELGLNVPGHAQSGNPLDPEYTSEGYDLTKAECDSLVNYLHDLPAPIKNQPAEKPLVEYLSTGEQLFEQVGCATCHTPELGDAKDIYSDLLLHDMGAQLGDTGSYGVFVPNSPGSEDASPVPQLTELKRMMQPTQQVAEDFGAQGEQAQATKIIGALQQEWRTPPLWGVRDSAPYLHDGRADTLEQAIALHGGEANRSAQMFFSLKPSQRLQLISFLKSLSAPTAELAVR